MGSSTHAEGGLVGDLWSRRGEDHFGREEGRRLKSPEGERAKEVYSGRSGRWTWVLRLLL